MSCYSEKLIENITFKSNVKHWLASLATATVSLT